MKCKETRSGREMCEIMKNKSYSVFQQFSTYWRSVLTVWIFLYGGIFANADTSLSATSYEYQYNHALECVYEKDYQKAMMLFQALLENYPSDSRLYEGLGDLYLSMHDFDTAVLWYKKGSALFPTHIGFYVGWGIAEQELKHAEEAIAAFRRVLQLDSQNYYAHVSIARLYELKGEMKTAEEWYRATLQINERRFSSYYGLGSLLRKQGRYEEALAVFEKGKKNNPSDVILYNESIARIYHAQGNYEKAEQLLVEITQDFRPFRQGHWGCPFQALGGLYAHRLIDDQKKKVLESFKRAAELDPLNSLSQYQAAQFYYEYGDYVHAEEYVDKAIYLSEEKQDDYRVLKGYILIALKKYSDAAEVLTPIMCNQRSRSCLDAGVAIAHLHLAQKKEADIQMLCQKKLQENPLDTMANLCMGMYHANRNEHKRALEFFEATLQEKPGYVWGLLGKGNSLLSLGKFDTARAVFQDILTIDPENQYAYAELGSIEYHQGNDRAAEALFNKALAVDNKTYTCPYEGLGLVYMRQGAEKRAVESFQKAIEINPDVEFRKYNGLARIYIQHGKYREAEELLKKSYENYPYDEEARILLRTVYDVRNNVLTHKDEKST